MACGVSSAISAQNGLFPVLWLSIFSSMYDFNSATLAVFAQNWFMVHHNQSCSGRKKEKVSWSAQVRLDFVGTLNES